MSKNSVKRTVIHSNDTNRIVCDGILSDHSEIEKVSVSNIIENLILYDFFPKNQRAFQWAALMYYPDDVRYSITDVLNRTFDYYAAGANWKAAYDNGFDLIRYTGSLISNTPNFSVKADPYLDSKFDSIASNLKNDAEGKIVTSLIGRSLDKDDVNHLITIIIDNWDVLGNWTITYRTLCVIMRNASKREDTPQERLDLIKVIDKISEVWDS